VGIEIAKVGQLIRVLDHHLQLQQVVWQLIDLSALGEHHVMMTRLAVPDDDPTPGWLNARSSFRADKLVRNLEERQFALIASFDKRFHFAVLLFIPMLT
jgi:hypothetical protein